METDPLRGYQDGGPDTYHHYNRMKKNAISTRNCRFTICCLVLIGLALTIAVIVIFSMDPGEVEVIPDGVADLKSRRNGWKSNPASMSADGPFDEMGMLVPGTGPTNQPAAVPSPLPRPASPRAAAVDTSNMDQVNERGMLVTAANPLHEKLWILRQGADADQRARVSRPRVDSGLINRCKKQGEDVANRRAGMEAVLHDVFLSTRRHTAAFYHQMSTPLEAEASELVQQAVVAEETIKCLRDHQVESNDLEKDDVQLLQKDWPQCHLEQHFPCPATMKYRLHDGSCNNEFKPLWGTARQPFRRIVSPDYNDSLSAPRTDSLLGVPLPPTRQVSLCFQNKTLKPEETKLNMLFVMFSQFLEADLISIAATKGFNGTGIPCCGVDSVARHPECFDVEMKANDPFYKNMNIGCTDFVRSAPAPTCTLGQREQMNQATSYVDLSNVYGTSEHQSRDLLRDLDGGYLRTPTEKDGRYMLPRSTDPDDGCNRPDMFALGRVCFKAGDSRVNQYIGLTVMQQLWMREHNRITDSLTTVNPNWDDDRLYEESRKIAIAIMQHVTYNEFLPLLLGKNMTEMWKLEPQQKSYDHDYDERVSASIANEFATAAFRMMHSMVQDVTNFEPNDGTAPYAIELHKMMYNPFSLWDYNMTDNLIRGAANQHPRPMHTAFSNEVANHLFEQEEQKETWGFDLFAYNLQRGRDHGIPAYVHFRDICNLSPVSNFTELEGLWREQALVVVQRFYQDARDVDLYTGLLAEIPSDDGLLGPVASCIMSDQFARLKRGDRFWYETGDSKLRFKPEQLDAIRKMTFARVICAGGDAMDAIQLRAFEPVSESNPVTPCTDELNKHSLDLTLWKGD